MGQDLDCVADVLMGMMALLIITSVPCDIGRKRMIPMSRSTGQQIPCHLQNPKFHYRTTFEAFAAVTFQVDVFWIVTPCSVVVGYQRFRGPCCLHFQCEVQTSNLITMYARNRQ
jgi:hypothetical protein